MLRDMGEKEYLRFYNNTATKIYSGQFKKYIRDMLEKKGLITYSSDEEESAKYFNSKNYNIIVNDTSKDKDFLDFYDNLDFIKTYKYSVPLFYEGDEEKLYQLLKEKKEIYKIGEWDYNKGYCIAESMKDAIPAYYENDEKKFIKFVVQKNYFNSLQESIDYRYVVLIYIDSQNKIIEIRYDNVKNAGEIDYKKVYENQVNYCIEWIKEKLGLKVKKCLSKDFNDAIKRDVTGNIKIFKQMMDMGTYGSAELTASEDTDYILPFIGEIKALIDDNKELFDSCPEIREIFSRYIQEKVETASYPYVYLLWKNAVVSKNFIFKVTFKYFERKFILIQHITATDEYLGMERMNDAIDYLAKNKAITPGEEI